MKTFESLRKVGEKFGANMHRCLLFPFNHFSQKLFISPEFTKCGNKTAAGHNLYPQMELSSYSQSICIFNKQVHFLYAEEALKCITDTNCD